MAEEKKKKIETRFLGKTGMKVSELCLGTMTFGWVTDEERSFEIMDAYKDLGGYFLDTADIYGWGENSGKTEEIVGKWLSKQHRDDFVLATKVRAPVGKGPNDIGLSRKHIISAVERSLERLQTDYIDLYQCHFWDSATPLKETLTTLNDLVRAGKVRYIGASNFTGWQLQKALDLSEHMGLEKYVCLQPQYSLLCRTTEWELLDICREEGLGAIAWSPLCGGWLSGKYKRGMEKPIEGARVEWSSGGGWPETSWELNNNEKTWNLLDVMSDISKETGKSHSQIALRWVLQRPNITCPIIGARNMQQFEDNVGAAFFELSEEHMNRLNEASDVHVPYPYRIVRKMDRPRH